MKDVRIELIVGNGCCIESAAKREYNRLMSRIMEADSGSGTDEESRLDLLIDFLQHADFPLLRSSNDFFAGIKNARCVLIRNNDGNPRVIAPDCE